MNYLSGYIRLVAFSCVLLLTQCMVKPKGGFVRDELPAKPDYSDNAAWAALPFTVDSADLVPPGQGLENRQDEMDADVFFIYPTTYTGKKGHNSWNADVYDQKLNERTDKTTIKYQASIFNAAGQVYAPRYRQAHLEAFYTRKHRDDARKALQIAYRDVESAFDYYLEHFNKGRPFIIAAHSQGTVHAGRLIREKIEGNHLKEQLITAYLVGMPVRRDYFEVLVPCKSPEQLECYCTWRTVKEGYNPKRYYVPNDTIVVTNPLLWTLSSEFVPAEKNLGAVLKKFERGLIPEFIGARADRGLLRVKRPKIPGIPFVPMRNYHIADYNFFYMNVRENAQLRVETYFRDRS